MSAEAARGAGASPRVTAGATPPHGWDELVARAPDATFFHRPVWTASVCAAVPGCEPLWLAVALEGQLAGGLAAVARRRGPWRHLASHHEGTAGGPLLDPGLGPAQRRAVADALLAAWTRLARAPRVLAAGLVLPCAADAEFGPLASARGWRRRDLPAAVLPLAGGIGAVEYGVLPKNRRNERNRALRRGCLAGVSGDAAALAEYYPVYLAAARRWGVEPAPQALLAGVLAGAGGDAFLSWVRWEGRIIGGHLCVCHGAEVTAWNGATLPEHNDKFPATLLIWTDVAEACRRGAERLDLGGSGGQAGVARFKELLGATTEVRGHYTVAAPAYAAWHRLRGALPRRRSAGEEQA